MLQKFVIFLLIFIFKTSSSLGFTWEKCRKVTRVNDPSGGAAFTSTTQFFSSFGPCSAFGKSSEHERKLYYAFNVEKLKVDVSQGGGETIHSFLKMFNCKNNEISKISLQLKYNYKDIFSKTIDLNYFNIKTGIERVCNFNV